jgi:deoxyribose-phosphate aldolase
MPVHGERGDPTCQAREIARLIDHTLLRADATPADVRRLCEEARQYGFAAVCINPSMVPVAARTLAGSGVRTCTVIGFPLGAATTAVKAFETRDAVANGAGELDMVLAVGRIKAGDTTYAQDDIAAVVEAANGAPVKVIIETALLSEEEKVAACTLAVRARAAFVKTCTGFAGSGATAEDIRLMRRVVGPDVGVKASGGIRTREDALRMIQAGANRLGTSAAVAIVTARTA